MWKEYFDSWKAKRSDIAKLQWFYVIFGLVLFLITAVIGLLNQAFAFRLLGLVGIVVTAFVCNFVAWSAIRSLVEARRTPRRK